MPIKYPCNICNNPVAKNHKAIQCDKCQLWVHIKCNKINGQTYKLLKQDETAWYCISCSNELFPFSSINNNEFHTTMQGKKVKFVTITKKRTSSENALIEKLNEAMDGENLDNSSSYFNIDNINTKFPKNPSNGTNFFHMNISSLCRNFDDLQTLLARINLKFNIIGITETKLKKNSIRNININLNGYVIEHTPTEGNCGGALLYIDNSLNYIVRSDLKIYKKKELESVFIEIINPKGKNLIVGCIYRHPCMNSSEFIDIYMSELLQKLSREDKTIMLMGDFNIDLLKYDSNKDSTTFLDTMYTSFLLPYITIPTRVTTHSKTLIDNIFSNNIEEGLTSGNIITTISDHYAQFLIQKSIKIEKNQTNLFRHNFKNFNDALFDFELENKDWKSILEIDKKDIDISFNNYMLTFSNLLQQHAPLKKLSNKEIKTLKKPWITTGILKSINKKNEIHRKSVKAKNPIRKEELHELYKTYKNSITKLTRRSKANYYCQFFEDNKKKLNKVWQGIKEIININKKVSQNIQNINSNGKLITNHKNIANTFNEFFCDIPKHIEKNILKTHKKFQDYLLNPVLDTFFLDPTNNEEVQSYIKTLKNNKSSGPSSIPNKLFKQFKKSLSEPLTLLINLTFSEGKFPTILKMGKIFPIHKKGSKIEVTNYRPISLLSNISKIIEKMVHDRLYMFLEQNEAFYNYQFGFRNNHSTNHALIEITEQIRNACDQKLYTCGVYLDLQKAFDTVNHEILLKKLKHYGIKGTSYDWFQSYLCLRLQYTQIKDDESSPKIVSHGVPQGSVLGPLLFILFINDMHNSVVHSKVHHYADDTNLLLTSNSLKTINRQVNHDLSLISHWLKANKISLNTTKTEIIVFRPKQKQITKHLNFRINGQKINTCSSVKYLGVILQENLEWNLHLNTLNLKLNRAIGLLCKIRHYVPKFLLKTLYYTIFHSHLIYACQIWGQSQAMLNKVQPLQDKALRIINFKPDNYEVAELYKKDKILKITDYVKLLNYLFVRDVLVESSIPSFQNFFTKSEDLHNHNTRHARQNSVLLRQQNTDFYGIKSIHHQAAQAWNTLQTEIENDILHIERSKMKEQITNKIINSY